MRLLGQSPSPEEAHYGGRFRRLSGRGDGDRVNFRELRKTEVQLWRIPPPRTSVNKGKRKGRGCYAPALVRQPPKPGHIGQSPQNTTRISPWDKRVAVRVAVHGARRHPGIHFIFYVLPAK